MRTTFGSFNTATSGLYAAQRSLDIANHNVSNAGTAGYSRQTSLQRATAPIVGDPSGVVGTGVETYDITQARSQFLDDKYWNQFRSLGDWRIKKEELNTIENIFNEPSNTGIRQVMDDFYSSMEELSKKPEDTTTRVSFVEKGSVLAASINRNGNELLNEYRALNFSVKTKVDEVNSLALRVANLNKQIFNYELEGHKANDLRDQRNLYVDKISEIVNVNVNESKDSNGNGIFDLKIGGITLINHFNYNKIDIAIDDSAQAQAIEAQGGGKTYKVVWAGAIGSVVKPLGGDLKGLLESRDGNGVNGDYRGIPFYLDKLNQFANNYAASINTIHKAGFGLDNPQTTGTEFFDTSVGIINATNLRINPALKSNALLVATASTAGKGHADNTNAINLINSRKLTNMFLPVGPVGTPDDFIKSVLTSLAVDSNQAIRMSDNAEALVKQTDIRRMSVSGVNLDEEMANLVKFQQAYNASAKSVSVLDKILDTMINRVGLVGR